MDIDLSPELDQFRREVIEFLDKAPTDAIREAGQKSTSVFACFEQAQAWLGILNQRGWAAPSWPKEYGGTGWSVEQRYIFEEEYRKRELPSLMPNGLKMIGPLIIALGTKEQKAKYLPRILAGEDYWTQGYSEPNSGSDLASLSCRAEVDGDDYIINGSKIWTTLAHKSNRMFMLVRTSSEGKKQFGITFLLLDRTDYAGMEIRPIVGLDGTPEFCEVFFDNVRVPQSGRIGAENEGWSVSKQLLQFERGVAATSPAMRQRIKRIRGAAASQCSPFGGTLADDPAFQTKLGELEAEVATLEHFEKLAISGHEIAQDPGLASISKIMDTELTQALSTLMKNVSGLDAVSLEIEALNVGSDQAPLGSDFDLVSMPYYLNSRATTIYAGTNEVQRDLITRTLVTG